jgi:hypothetical protein
MAGDFSEDEELAFIAERDSSGESSEQGHPEDISLINSNVVSGDLGQEKEISLLRPDKVR